MTLDDNRPLRVLIISINYAPELTGFGPHVASLAEFLSARAHRVTVLTGFPFSPQWRRWSDYRGRVAAREERHGVEVIRVSHFIPRRPDRAFQRMSMDATFDLMALASLWRSRGRPWDVVFYCGAQPGLALLARWLAWWMRVPYLVSIQDLAARAALDVGIVKGGRLASLLARTEFAAYAKADRAIVLCEAFKTALVDRGFPPDRVDVVRSPVDLDLIRPVQPSGTFRAGLGLALEDFVVLYAGSMGLKQGLANVIAAASYLRARVPAVKWVLVGDGESKPMLRDLVDAQELTGQVKLLPLQPTEALPDMLASADILLLNQVAAVKTSVVPSKLLTYMSAGKPVLAAVHGQSQGAELLRESGGGLVVAPDDPVALADGVRWLRERPRESLTEMASRNRRFAEQQFDRARILEQQEAALLAAVAQRRRAN